MTKEIEYQALREEIMFSMKTVKNYRTFMYTVVVATLAFAIDKEDPILCLIPFCIIIPLFLLAMHQIDSTLRIGAYIYVFLEPGTECQWETRIYKYDKKHRNEYSTKKSSIDPYWCVSLCCLILSIIYLDFIKIDIMFFLTIMFQATVLITSIYVFITKRVDYEKTKEKYINEWKSIKKNEKNK